MSNRIVIDLNGDDVTHYHIQGRQIWLKTDTHETIVMVPRANRATYWPRDERASIHVGSLTVAGPLNVMQNLWDTITDSYPTV